MRASVLTATVIVGAILARVFGKLDYFPVTAGLVRSFLYIGLYIAWGVSVRKRVIQRQVRWYLTAVSVLMVFWFAVRTMKYYLVFDPDAARHLWYLYYLPMLFIPLFSLLAAMSLGKQEDYRLPRRTLLLYVLAVLCLTLILTNDFHRMVFGFPAGEVWTDKSYSYECGYYLAIGLEIVYALTAFAIMVIKCRTSKRKKHLPIILLAVSIVYAFIYVSGVRWMQIIGGDITAVQCLLFSSILESCIRCGLIRTNTGYGALFEAGTLGAQITDATIPCAILRLMHLSFRKQ